MQPQPITNYQLPLLVSRLLITVYCLLITVSCRSTSPTPTPTPIPTPSPTAEPSLTLLAFGDSLTEGLGVAAEDNYPAQLQRKLQADGYSVAVINGGISGETSSAALSRVEWMLGTHPDIVIVETGANDALRGVDLVLTHANIDSIVGQFSDSGAVVIVAGMQIIQNLGEDYTSEFAAIYPDVAEKHGSILIPFVLEGVAADPALNQPDFIHPNAAGYTVMVDHIYPFVLDAIEQVQP
ncbi:MAG: arylesterase [Ardenticatenaceae bacterium]|nr:arylesterase [Ardenticatenaceae bacterium]